VLQSYISAIDYYLPETVLDNDSLSRMFPEWTAQQIEQKTGIRSRHIAHEKETSADMALKAAQKLLGQGKASAAEIDFVLLCTQSPDYFLPTSACIIQHRLGVPKHAGALDFNLGCSGYVYGLSLAKGLIESGAARCILLLTSETYSKFLDPQDKGGRSLFGDGAAATIIRGREEVDGAPPLIGPFVFGTDGSGANALIVEEGGLRRRSPVEQSLANGKRKGQYLRMEGPEIFSFALKVVPSALDELLRKSSMSLDAVDLFIFHQANRYMLETLRKQVEIPREKFVFDLEDKGNTVSSTIPIAMADAYAAGRFAPRQRLVLMGFGVGLSWAATSVAVPGGI
jgi:3-oxoacyl-[acyl-carrier-protein] synthase-3